MPCNKHVLTWSKGTNLGYGSGEKMLFFPSIMVQAFSFMMILCKLVTLFSLMED